MLLEILLLCFCFVLFTEGTCESVTFGVSVNSFNVNQQLGNIILSTNQCQAIKQTIGPFYISGALKAYCVNNNQILVEFFDDIYCNQQNNMKYLQLNDSFTIANLLQFTLNAENCNQQYCHIDFVFAQNCSLSNSNTYLNISLPFDFCMSLNDTYARAAIDNILPSSFSQLLSDSVQLSCCSDDESLLIVNYSDSACLNQISRIRLSKDYAETCFRLSSNKNSKNQYITLINWKCANTVDCTNVPYMTNDSLPSECNSTCLSKLYPNQNDKDVTNSKTSSSKVAIIVSTIFSVLIFAGILYAVYAYTRRKKMREQIAKQTTIMSADNTKYEPMINDDGTNNEINEHDPTGARVSIGNGIHIHEINDHNDDENNDHNNKDNDNNNVVDSNNNNNDKK